jgi:hypothetical protein
MYDSQTTNRNQEGLPTRTPTPSGALLLIAWDSYMTLSQPEYTKVPPDTSGYSYFLREKLPKTTFLYKNL